MATVQRRKSDSALFVRGDTAIAGLTLMIVEAVKAGDETQVERLDRILCEVERLIEQSQGSPPDRLGN